MVWMHRGPHLRAVLATGVQVVTKNPRVSVSQEGQSFVLAISNVTRRDKGAYLCQLNTKPTLTQTIFLEVVGEWEINLVVLCTIASKINGTPKCVKDKGAYLCQLNTKPTLTQTIFLEVVGEWEINLAVLCTIASKINVTPKCVYMAISKLNSILAVANLLAHNNISQIYYLSHIFLLIQFWQ